ncbi:microtubule-associated serine/threonine-protein kinase 3-like isoform X3 [Dermacentor albipictus]|uniref:microtubule-associated serine/threonine-protein kinase 3-like isoform X3 n=1 Tax=Dermacentor albipictus TaxID=60249 RepID=UPI0038FCC800
MITATGYPSTHSPTSPHSSLSPQATEKAAAGKKAKKSAVTLSTLFPRVSVPPQPPFWAYIPKMGDFESIKILGAGGYGVVHLATYKPANLVTTVKLVNMDRFTRQKHAAMDKVLASVVRNPFMVKYYSCFTCKQAYVTVMEYVAGVDLMRVLSREHYLEIDAVQIIMAQLILALQHMHCKGFLHRDIKVSNMLILPGGRLKVIDFDTTKVCHGLFSKRGVRGFFRKTPFEFNDAESAGTVPYMAPEVLRQRPYGRSVDWWSAGIVMYKLMMGRVPFRGKNREAVRDRIIAAPLRFPRSEDREHSATTPAKDMTFRMLRKNAIDRLGSRSYAELKTHPFFDRFNWKRLHRERHLCDIPSVGSLVNVMRSKQAVELTSIADKRRKLKLEDMRDVSADGQRPLLCFSSSSFKKLILAVERAKEPIAVSDSFMETTEEPSSEISYALPLQPSDGHLLGALIDEEQDGVITPVSLLVGADKVDVVLYRKKCYKKFWGFGFALRRLKGEDNINYLVVYDVRPESPADKSQLLVLDFVLKVNGETVLDMALGRVKALITASGDQLLLTVMSSSPYRALTTRRDMMAVLRSAALVNVTLQPTASLCSLQKTYGVELLEPDVWDDRGKQFAKVYVIKTANTSLASGAVYPGDVVWTLNGAAVEQMPREQVYNILYSGRAQLPVALVPLSPLRTGQRVHISKLRESTLSDAHLITRLTAAAAHEESD